MLRVILSVSSCAAPNKEYMEEIDIQNNNMQDMIGTISFGSSTELGKMVKVDPKNKSTFPLILHYFNIPICFKIQISCRRLVGELNPITRWVHFVYRADVLHVSCKTL